MDPDYCPIFCDRCGTEVRPGTGSFYVIHIHAVADPTPPADTGEDPKTLRRQIEQLLAQMQELSEQEAMDQVHRRLTLFLCNSCYGHWIENPIGQQP